ncbi:hypothetical protein ACFQVA_14760 [Actinomadura keratinilytica]
MKLAEALAERAAAVRRVEQLRSRVEASARYQEGRPRPRTRRGCSPRPTRCWTPWRR